MNLPDSNFISAPLWLLNTLHWLTLSLHFFAMNLLFGGVLITLIACARKQWEHSLAQRLVRLFPVAMAATVTLGVAPLLFLQVVYPRQVYSASVVSAWFWLMIFVAVIVAYYALYRASFGGETSGKTNKAALLLALLGLLYVSLVYSSVFSLSERPEAVANLYAQDQSGLVVNPAADFILRWMHMILGAITVGGFFVGVLGRDRPEVYGAGKMFFLWGVVLAALTGMAYLLSLVDYLRPFMRSPAIWVLTVAIVLTLGSLHFFLKKSFWPASLMLFLSVFGMVYARHTVRLLRLEGQFDPASWPVAPQWSPFILFLLCFVIALAVLAYMLRLVFATKKNAA